MNPESPQSPRELLEARLTALALGELSPAEAAELTAALAQDPELSRENERLKIAIQRVRDTEGPGAVELPRLDAARRERLLADFQVAPSSRASRRMARAGERRRELAALAAMLAALLTVGGWVGSELGVSILEDLEVSNLMGHRYRYATVLPGRRLEEKAGQEEGQVLLHKSAQLMVASPPSLPAPVMEPGQAAGTAGFAMTPAPPVSHFDALSPASGPAKADETLAFVFSKTNHASAGATVRFFDGTTGQAGGLGGASRQLSLSADNGVNSFALGDLAVPAPAAAPLPLLQVKEAELTQDRRKDRALLRESVVAEMDFVGGKSLAAERPVSLGVAVSPTGATDAKVTKLAESLSRTESDERRTAGKSERFSLNQVEAVKLEDAAKPRSVPPPSPFTPQPEKLAAEDPFSTFSLHVSDVSFQLAAASLEKGVMPDAAGIRGEEFINAFDYHDPEASGNSPLAFAWERARYPFAQGRDVLRLSVKTAASGRSAGRPMNLVLLIDNSGSMERADRVRIRQECLRTLAGLLGANDRISVVAFARTARLHIDALPGNQAGDLAERVGTLVPEGGTNLEEALALGYQTAVRRFIPGGVNRVVLLTDGAANLGEIDPGSLRRRVESARLQGVALDCFGIGWEGLDDALLESLSRNGDGRYGFLNTPEAASSEFAGRLAGALQVAASDVKVQVEFNSRRVAAHRQVGYALHQLTKEQFRQNAVDAGELGAAEAGNAVYVIQVLPDGDGPVATVRVRFRVPGTDEFQEHAWEVPYQGPAPALERSTESLRLATAAAAFSEWLTSSPHAGEVTPDGLITLLSTPPLTASRDPRPRRLEGMIRQAKTISGR